MTSTSDKLITVVVWATVILVVYEALKSVLNGSSSQLGGGTLGEVASGLAEDVASLGAYQNSPVYVSGTGVPVTQSMLDQANSQANAFMGVGNTSPDPWGF